MTGRCEVFDTLGVRRREFSVPLRRAAMRSGDWAVALAEHFRGEPSRAFRKVAERLLTEVRRPESFPLLDAIRADVAGNLWVRTVDGYSSPTATWLVLTEAGRPLALVATPRAINVLEIGADYVLAVATDDDDVEYVVTYAVARTREVR